MTRRTQQPPYNAVDYEEKESEEEFEGDSDKDEAEEKSKETKQVDKLIHDAKCYEQGDKFEKARELIDIAMTMDPQRLECYKISARLYAKQGRYDAALNVYKQAENGIDWGQYREDYKRDCLEDLEEKYQELQEIAQRVKNNPVDFIIMLNIPSNMIFEHLAEDSQTIFQCLYVSKRWRNFILSNCPFIWQSARWEDCSPAFVMMEKVTPHITSIESVGWMPGHVNNRYRSIVENASLDKVRELKTDALVQQIDMEKIMKLCPNIVNLAFDVTSTKPRRRSRKDFKLHPDMIKPFSDETATTYPNLRSLIIHDRPLNPAITRGLFHRAPNLLAFGTSTSNDYRTSNKDNANFKRIIEQLDIYCLPRLKWLLILPNESYEFLPIIKKINEECCDENSRKTKTELTKDKGIKYIIMAPEKGTDLTCLAPIVEKSRETLQTLIVNLRRYLDIEDEDYDKEFPVCLKHWRYLFNHGRDGEMPSFFTIMDGRDGGFPQIDGIGLCAPSLIQKSPKMTCLSLENIIHMGETLMSAFSMLCVLQMAKFTHCTISSEMEEYFLDYASPRKIFFPLSHLEFVDCYGFKKLPFLWEALVGIPDLDYFRISNCKLERKNVQNFVRRYCKRSDPWSLHLENLESVSSEEIFQLLKSRGKCKLKIDPWEEKAQRINRRACNLYSQGDSDEEDEIHMGYDMHKGMRYHFV
ncbi:hypothetical protein BDA99DRAFT_532823 [Phascolomyces articulosus]|uniref:F-box domain-containing protein n=1 Tax=Phascolomyces articulosus TaxID=60185 RepID=A0AAD5KUN7_9FUNG|nr:hypothetical protein BDA99DRAFT_532823 [Phascolomyces articulosus]